MFVMTAKLNKKKLTAIANMIKAEYELSVNAVDRIPSAYPCDKERIVILATSIKGKLPDDYRLYVRELTKARAANVAIIAAGDDACVESTKALLTEAGTNVIDEVKKIKIGFLDNKVSDEEKTDILAWVEKVKAELK